MRLKHKKIVKARKQQENNLQQRKKNEQTTKVKRQSKSSQHKAINKIDNFLSFSNSYKIETFIY